MVGSLRRGVAVAPVNRMPTGAAACIPDEPKAKAARRSRPRRWAASVEAVSEAADLMELREEYEAWRDNLPDNQRDGILAEKLDATIAAVERFEEMLDELENMDLPLGFGRD